MFGANPFGSSTFGGLSVSSVLINVSEPIVNVFEGDTIAEQIIVVEDFLTVQPLPIDPNINDSVTTSESTALNLKELLDIFDATTITDIAGFYPDLVIVTENVKMLLSSLGSVFDAATISENLQMQLNPVDLDVFDSTTTSEITITDIPETNNVFDTVSVTEFSNVIITLEQGVFDSVTTSESTNLNLMSNISVVDSSVTSESVTFSSLYTEAVFDLSSVTEFVSILLPIDQGLLIHVDTYDD